MWAQYPRSPSPFLPSPSPPTSTQLLTDRGRPLGLYLEQLSVASIPVSYLSVSMRPPASGSFTLAYLGSIDISEARSQHLTPPLNGDWTNWVGFRRAITLQKMYTPVDPQKDPYLVALVIALAQRDRRHAVQPLPPDSSFTVRLSLAPPFPFTLVSQSVTNHLTPRHHVQVRILCMHWGRIPKADKCLRCPCVLFISPEAGFSWPGARR